MSKSLKNSLRSSNPFDLINSDSNAADDATFESIDEKLFGVIERGDAHRQMASPVVINEIHPDPKQPRRAIPNTVREKSKWDGNLDQIGMVFETWVMLINEWRLRRELPEFNLGQYLNQEIEIAQKSDIEDEKTPDLPQETSSLEQSLIDLIELATSIRSDGLANPITVEMTPGRGYIIETGERRWLAYHLLYWYFQDDKFAQISARTVDKLNIWRQAAENNARSNLNAISKARQFAVLLMDLLKTERGMTFKSFETIDLDQTYYAQVADGEEYRIPRGMSEKLLNATGLKSGKQLREYRALLNLPRDVWVMADDLNWPERAIRDLRSHAMNDDDLVHLAAKKAEAEGYTVPMGTLSTKRLQQSPKKANAKKVQPEVGEKQYFNEFLKVLNRAKNGREDALDVAFEEMKKIREWLDEQEFQLSNRK